MININNTDRYTEYKDGFYIDHEKGTLVYKDGTVFGHKQKLSDSQQEALNNFWAVINDEKTYKEAFPDKE